MSRVDVVRAAGASVVVVDLAAFLLFSLIQRGIAATARK